VSLDAPIGQNEDGELLTLADFVGREDGEGLGPFRATDYRPKRKGPYFVRRPSQPITGAALSAGDRKTIHHQIHVTGVAVRDDDQGDPEWRTKKRSPGLFGSSASSTESSRWQPAMRARATRT
jgi:hypothetical protein